MADTDGLETGPSHLTPSGLGLGILCITCVLSVLVLVTVSLRTFSRISARQFGFDDLLMLLGFGLFVTYSGIISYNTFVGLGAKNELLTNPSMLLDGLKYIIIGQIFYVVAICFIRAAICMSFLRVTESKFCRITVQCICFFSCVNFVTGFVSAVTSCRPLSAIWNPGTGECFDLEVITDLGYFVSALNIVTDVACAVVAYFIFKSSEMKTPVRIASVVVQVLGAMACLAAFAHIAFVRYYREPANNPLYHVGFIHLFSNLECGIGAIAGSLPMLRRLFWKNLDEEKKERQKNFRQTPLSFLHFGAPRLSGMRSSVRGKFGHPAIKGISKTTIRASRRENEWSQLELEDAYMRGVSDNSIMEHKTVTVEYEMREWPRNSRLGSLVR